MVAPIGLLLIAGCKSNDPRILGDWAYSAPQETQTFHFKDNGTFTEENTIPGMGKENTIGTYSFDGQTLTVNIAKVDASEANGANAAMARTYASESEGTSRSGKVTFQSKDAFSYDSGKGIYQFNRVGKT